MERTKEKPKVTEHQTQNAILQYLTVKKVFAWRNNTGAMPIDAPGGRRFIRFGAKGSPDIMAILPPNGRFLAIEVKGPRGVLSDAQKEFLSAVQNRGGYTIVAKSVDDVERFFAEYPSN